MTEEHSLDHLDSDTWLRDNPVAAHLGSDEAAEHVLTNREVGLRFESDASERQIPPADDCGAVAALTDRRVLFLVGDPPERQGDYVDSVPYEAIEASVAETETLTQRVRVETDGETYAFTARETGVVDDVQSFLETAATVYADGEAHLDAAAEARETLESALAEEDWDACDDAISEARVALADAAALVEDTPFAPMADRVESVRETIDDLARKRHRRHAEALAEESEALLADHEYEQSHQRIEAARHHVEAAETLVDDQAAADGGTQAETTVATTHRQIEDLAETLRTRPVEDATDYHDRAAETDDEDERIDLLETAFECYRSAAALLADDDTPFEGDETAARDDAERVIADLVDARLEEAETARTAGEWERQADNPRSAYDLLTEAKDHAERALELANAYPPGDAATIEEELDAIEEILDPLRIEVELSDSETEV